MNEFDLSGCLELEYFAYLLNIRVLFSCLQSIASAVLCVVPCPNSYFKIENTSQNFHSQSPESELDKVRFRHMRSLVTTQDQTGHTE